MYKLSPFMLERVVVLCLSVLMFSLGCEALKFGINEREYTAQFKSIGVKTQATLIGYRYLKSMHRQPNGDRPVFSYTSKDGIKRTYIASEYGLATNLKKQVLSTQQITITYLPNKPEIARVEKWGKYSSGIVDIIIGSLMCLMGLFGPLLIVMRRE